MATYPTKTPRDWGWADYAGQAKLLTMAGIGLDEPMVELVRSDFAGDDCVPVTPPTAGLVHYTWEEGDEMHRDGVCLYRTESARFYSDVWVKVDGKVVWLAMSNDCLRLDPHNDVCPPSTRTWDEIPSDVRDHEWLMDVETD